MIFSSAQPHLNIPTHLTVWDWLLDSEHSPLRRANNQATGGFTDALTEQRIDYNELRRLAVYLSISLIERHGLKAGDTVAIMSHNSIWYPVAVMAAVRAGAIVSVSPPALGVEEMTYNLQISRAKFIITVPNALPAVTRAAGTVGVPDNHIFVLEKCDSAHGSIHDCIDDGRAYPDAENTMSFKMEASQTNRDVCGFLLYSSGTTGLPKAVMLSHHNIIAQCMQMEQLTTIDQRKALAYLPLYHVIGLLQLMFVPMFRNAEVYILPGFSMVSMLDTLVKYHISEAPAVPPILLRFLHDPEIAKYDLSQILVFATGGAPVPQETIGQLETVYPSTRFKQGYGMTESSGCISTHPPGKQTYQYAHTVGSLVANTEIRILDPDTGLDLGLNQAGEVLCRGPQVAMGYLNNDEATLSTFDNEGWLHTGDVAFLDEEGLLHIVDRMKELIKVKGTGVSPVELEQFLMSHPDVEDVAVAAVTDAYTGERPKAYVVLRGHAYDSPSGTSDRTSIHKELIDYVRAGKERHKWITGVEFVAKVPRNPSGKILRRALGGAESTVQTDKRATANDCKRRDVWSKL